MGTTADEATKKLVEAKTNPDSFAVVYQTYAKTIFSYHYRRTFCHEVAADLTAETFAVAIKQVRKFDPSKGNAAMWIYGIAAKELASYWRKGKTSDKARRRLNMVTPTISEDDLEDLDDTFDAPLLDEALQSAMHRLSEDSRTAIWLRVVEGLPYNEIALKQGCSVSAARVRVSRGLSELSKHFNDQQSPFSTAGEL